MKVKKKKKKVKHHLSKNGKIRVPTNPDAKEAYPEDLKREAKIMFMQGKSYSEIRNELIIKYDKVPAKCSLSRWRKNEKWDQEREKHVAKIHQQAMQEIVDTAAQTKGRAYDLLNELEARVRAKLYTLDEETGKPVARFDIEIKELKALVDMAHKIIQDRLALNPDPTDQVEKLAETLEQIQERYKERERKLSKKVSKKRKKKQLTMENDPETGFIPPSSIANDAKAGLDTLD